MSTTLKPGDRLKHFEILKLLGKGGMGEVYLAKDDSLDRQVAIKTLNIPEEELIDNINAIKRFLAEAKILAQLSSPSITTIHYISKAEERIPFIVMEYLEGESLKEYSLDNKLTTKYILECLINVCDGLAEVHSKNIIHRDIKPANLFYTSNQKFKILDFGIAKFENDNYGVETQTNQFVGSLLYAAPEAFSGKGIDHRSDIYSLGITMVHLLIGKSPFSGGTTFELLNQIQNMEIRFNGEISAQIPEELRSLIYEMIEKDPRDRPQNMLDVKKRAMSIIKLRDTVLDKSISRYIEEREINIDDTVELRALVKNKVDKPKVVKSEVPKTLRSKSNIKRPRKVSRAKQKKKGTANVAMVAAAVVLIALFGIGAFSFFNEKEIESNSVVEANHSDLKVKPISPGTPFKRLSTIKSFDSTYMLIKDLKESEAKKTLQSKFHSIEKSAMKILDQGNNLSREEKLAIIRKFRRKLLLIDNSLEKNNLSKANERFDKLDVFLKDSFHSDHSLERLPSND